MKTPEEIDAMAMAGEANTTLLAYTRRLNAIYRAADESHKWPICGRFNATERAIRQCRKFARDTGVPYTAHDLDFALSQIVNEEVIR